MTLRGERLRYLPQRLALGVEIIGLRCAHMTSVQHDFAAALGGKTKILLAPTPRRGARGHWRLPTRSPHVSKMPSARSNPSAIAVNAPAASMAAIAARDARVVRISGTNGGSRPFLR
jgi:hypothetical protein